MMKLNKLTYELFEKYVVPDKFGCWIWNGYRRKDGYVNIFIGGKAYLAHRISYLIFNGNIPAEKCVLHRCDIRNCINPKHLWLGTYKDNNADMRSKGRGNYPRGEKISWSKLNEVAVREIRKTERPWYPKIKNLAEKYNVHPSTINHVLYKRHWAWIN